MWLFSRFCCRNPDLKHPAPLPGGDSDGWTVHEIRHWANIAYSVSWPCLQNATCFALFCKDKSWREYWDDRYVVNSEFVLEVGTQPLKRLPGKGQSKRRNWLTTITISISITFFLSSNCFVVTVFLEGSECTSTWFSTFCCKRLFPLFSTPWEVQWGSFHFFCGFLKDRLK